MSDDISLRRVLYATDFSPIADAAFAHAATIAENYHATLYVAHVIDPESFDKRDSEPTPAVIKQLHEQAAQKINRMLSRRPVCMAACETIVTEGVVAEALVDLLRRNHIDLAVLGTHGRRALGKLLLGSIAEEVFRMAECPVLTISPKSALIRENAELRHILYPLQLQPDSSEAAKYAVSLAQHFSANLTVMNVREDLHSSASQEEKQDQIVEPFKSWIEDHISPDSNLRNRVHFERGFGPAAQAILEFASRAAVDLIVMSVDRLDPIIAAHLPVPDTAYELITRASCPVLTIH
jgi:nucleotide-binding universal stress UspA family protein